MDWMREWIKWMCQSRYVEIYRIARSFFSRVFFRLNHMWRERLLYVQCTRMREIILLHLTSWLQFALVSRDYFTIVWILCVGMWTWTCATVPNAFDLLAEQLSIYSNYRMGSILSEILCTNWAHFIQRAQVARTRIGMQFLCSLYWYAISYLAWWRSTSVWRNYFECHRTSSVTLKIETRKAFRRFIFN